LLATTTGAAMGLAAGLLGLPPSRAAGIAVAAGGAPRPHAFTGGPVVTTGAGAGCCSCCCLGGGLGCCCCCCCCCCC
jgi:hypothetical protein